MRHMTVGLAALLAASLASAPAADAQSKRLPGCAPKTTGGEWRSYGRTAQNPRHQPAETRIGPANAQGLAPAFAFDTAEEGMTGSFVNTPTVADGCVYGATQDAWVFALNATTGELVWKRRMPWQNPEFSGALVSSLLVTKGKVVGAVNDAGQPYSFALSQKTGRVVWRSETLDDHVSANAISSPVLLPGGLVFQSFGNDIAKRGSRGGYAFLDVASGAIVKRSYIMSHEEATTGGFGGGTIWATGAYDPRGRYVYVGVGNPSPGRKEHPHTNAIIKIDADPARGTFGSVVDSYKGDTDQYPVTGADKNPACEAGAADALPYPANQAPCLQTDLDFGASPNLFRDAQGRLLVGQLQKSGTFHAAYTATMDPAWRHTVAPPCFPCNAASSAFDGKRLFAVGSPAGQMVAMGTGGSLDWVAPIGDGDHYHPVSTANGVAYTYDGTAVRGFDAESGLPVLYRSVGGDAGATQESAQEIVGNPGSITGGNSHPLIAGALSVNSSGLAIARHTLYVAAGQQLVALRLPAGTSTTTRSR